MFVVQISEFFKLILCFCYFVLYFLYVSSPFKTNYLKKMELESMACDKSDVNKEENEQKVKELEPKQEEIINI